MDSATSPIWRVGITSQALCRQAFNSAAPCTLTRGQPSPRFAYPSASPRHSSTDWWYRNINRLSIDYASRPRLRSRLTLGGLTLPRNPWAFGGRVSHPSFATHTGILSSLRSIDESHTGNPSGSTSLPRECSPTHHAPKGAMPQLRYRA